MSVKNRFAAGAAAAAFVCLSFAVFAEDHPYSEGAVVNVARIRTVDGHFDDYMKWLATEWKKQQEIAKKLGYIVGYEVMTVEARSADDADILLVTRYKNWAALDGALAKGDETIKQLGRTNDQSNKEQAGRASIRRVLGSSTMQVLDLK
ncbi:MAG TPA: hypothetical protein VMU03_10225 [Gammaproteobacteria bacterium]|jgi:hypothetical protein|nr:hypothetical protein [Gammaproteobacteria bacterium]